MDHWNYPTLFSSSLRGSLVTLSKLSSLSSVAQITTNISHSSEDAAFFPRYILLNWQLPNLILVMLPLNLTPLLSKSNCLKLASARFIPFSFKVICQFPCHCLLLECFSPQRKPQ